MRRRFTRRERRGGSVRGSRNFRRFWWGEFQRYIAFWDEAAARQVMRENTFFEAITRRASEVDSAP